MKSNKKSIKEKILIFLLILLLVLVVGISLIVFFYKGQQQETQNLYSINIRGYTLDNEFHPLIYEYNAVVNEDIIEISCNTNSKIEGCNTKINLTDKSMYTHKIIVHDGRESNIYKINIIKKIDTQNENNDFYIKEIEGNVFEWTNNDVTIEVIMSKEGTYLYSFDGGQTWQESNTKTVNENSKLKVIAKNEEDILSNVKNVEVDKIDKEKPTATINKTRATNSKMILDVVPYDKLSGVDSISFNGNNYSTNTKYEVTKPGKYYFTIKDNAGNISEKYFIEVKESDFIKSTKKYTVTLNANGAVVEKNSISCSTSSDSCEIILPNIITDGTVLGWATRSDSINATYKEGETIKLTKNLTLFAITKKTYTVTFDKNGATSIGSTSLSCSAYNSNNCSITTPSITTSGTVIGWNTSSNATTSIVGVNKALELSGNITLYAITKKTYTATFVNNGLDYLETSSLSCNAYNTNNSCTIRLPSFNKKGHFNSFWGTSSNVSSNLVGQKWTWSNFNQVGHLYTLKENEKLYPNFNHFHYDISKNQYKYRSINIIKTCNIGNSLFEFENGIPQSIINNFINKMNSVKNVLPHLFIPGKIFVMTETTYDNYSYEYGLTHNMFSSHGGDSYINIDVQYDTSINEIDTNAIIHELGHAWDSYYKYKTNTLRISSTTDFNNLYKSIDSKLFISENGSKISKTETFAAMVTNYYWHVLKYDVSKGYYGLKEGYTLNTAELKQLKQFMEKYINFSLNGY